jgi:hypothetical protein
VGDCEIRVEMKLPEDKSKNEIPDWGHISMKLIAVIDFNSAGVDWCANSMSNS